MAFIPVPHGARAVVKFSKGTEEFSNTIHFTKTDYTEADQQALATAIDAQCTLVNMWAMPTSVNYIGVDVYDARSDTGLIKSAVTNGHNGSASGEALPVNLALVLTLYTESRGRSARGRLYIGGHGEGAWDGSEFLTTTETAVEDWFGDVVSAAAAIGWTAVIASKQHNNVVLPTATTYTITDWSVRNRKPGTQRRRVDRP